MVVSPEERRVPISVLHGLGVDILTAVGLDPESASVVAHSLCRRTRGQFRVMAWCGSYPSMSAGFRKGRPIRRRQSKWRVGGQAPQSWMRMVPRASSLGTGPWTLPSTWPVSMAWVR